ncbi:MAG TPA: hypothetical protein PKE16_11545, partial [Hyphomicrobium sp.]|nr:hypothetical protein [Hyphomicrobium sp.]
MPGALEADLLRITYRASFRDSRTSEMKDLMSIRRVGVSLSRSAALFALVALVQLLPQFATSGHAQSLWEQLQRNYGSDTSTNSTPVDHVQQQLDDLRPDSTPWRSDVM